MTTSWVSPGPISTLIPSSSMTKVCTAAPWLGIVTVTSVLAGMVISFGFQSMSTASIETGPAGAAAPSAAGVAASISGGTGVACVDSAVVPSGAGVGAT